MLEIRIHGRGGQGAVVAAKILAVAAAREGLFVQAFPEFGVERRGAPVCAYVRVARTTIYEREQIRTPGCLLVLDRTLIETADVTKGLKSRGWIVVNSQSPPQAYRAQLGDFRTATVDGNSIALALKLGSQFAPIVNTTMLGAFARAVAFVRLETLLGAIRSSVPSRQEDNVQAAVTAYQEVSLAAAAEELWTEATT
jgi:2-oxoacid:acceptor oxidoreductase gamma subunit (pyruvate/2-ketoisovalerate family)